MTRPANVEEQLVAKLRERGETVAFCESLTAGLAAATVANVPGASAVLRGGLVTYATEVKAQFLNTTVDSLEAQGVVSAATAAEMAEAALVEMRADWGIGLTGVAGPDLQEGKPAGTVYVGLCGRVGGDVAKRGVLYELPDERRNAIRAAAVQAALSLLLSTLEEK
ncbi:competence protein [Corynebacterium sp. HMSC035E02]|uniref:nicotinamide-nucleotide amidohydrolase family protein n=1 Tax=Corynebacterium sp. HMSC035E02 TaxID=1715114 RepID=UPI0008A9F85C|nr:nicotinamide-nucleotide amidohydrolase family protein [Corynebacterium sp. HMSC035E02]OHO56111.1 competence protein [Corynebacterium sp. HMSC035E02]